MEDLEPLKQALYQAHAAGDFGAAKKIANKLKELQSSVPTAITAKIEEPTQPSINDDMNFGEKSLVTLGRSVDKLLKGGQRVYYSATGNDDEANRVRIEAENNNDLWQKHASTGMKIGEVASDIGLAFLPMGAAGKGLQVANAGLKTRMAAQATIGAGQDYIYQKGEGVDKIDLKRTALSASLGGLAEGLSPMITRAYARYTTSGKQAMEKGIAVLNDAGIDPNQIEVEKIIEIGKSSEQLSSKVKPSALVAQKEFDIPMTRGQMTGDRGLQMAEHDLMGTPQGENLKRLESQQYEAINVAKEKLQQQYSKGSKQLDGAFDSGDVVGDAVMESSEQLARKVDEAYNPLNTSKAFLDKQAFTGLSDRALKSVSDANILVDELTPATKGTIQYLANITDQLGDNVKSVSIKKVENIRRVINNQVSKAKDADKKAVLTVKREFDNWLDESFTSGLMSGDETVYAQLKQARELRSEYAKKFEADKFISEIVDGERSANEVVNYFIGVGKVGAKGKAVKAIQTLKQTLGEDHQAINSLKEAVLLRIVDKKGVNAIASDLSDSITKGSKGFSYMRELFTHDELAQLSRFKQAVDHLVPDAEMKNFSNSGYVILRQLANKIPGINMIRESLRSVDANNAAKPLLATGSSLSGKLQSAPLVGAFTNREAQGTSRQF